MRNIELLVYLYKSVISIINSTFNSLDYSITALIVFSIIVFKTNLSISVATAVAARKLIKQFDKDAKACTNLKKRFLEILVSTTRMQDFLKCEEANLSAIEYTQNEDIAINIQRSHYFWGFEEHKNLKKIKKNRRQDQESSMRSKI